MIELLQNKIYCVTIFPKKSNAKKQPSNISSVGCWEEKTMFYLKMITTSQI